MIAAVAGQLAADWSCLFGYVLAAVVIVLWLVLPDGPG